MRAAVRSWLIRGLILAGVAALIGFAWLANSWVSPERVRTQLVAHLAEQFEGVEVRVGSARMRILGGIAVTDLTLTRRGEAQPFLVVPSAVIYHDKEQLNRGRLVIRKVELENPELFLERAPDGSWNLDHVLREGTPADKPIPTFVVKGAKVHVADLGPNPLPPLNLNDVQLTLLNDPLPMLTVQAHGAAAGFGAFTARVQLNRISRQATVRLDLPELSVAAAAAAAGSIAPEFAPHLAKLNATAAVHADLTFTPDTTPEWRHEIRLELKDGRYEHPELPWPVENLMVKARCIDGLVKVDEAAAKFGPAQVRFALETRRTGTSAGARPAAAGSTPEMLVRLEDHLEKLDLSVAGLPLDDALFARLGERGAKVKAMFSPVGVVDCGYKFTREAAGWKREFEVRPQAVSIVYESFRFPVTEVRGWLKRTVTHAGQEVVQVDLRGSAGGQVTLKGQLVGEGPDPAVNLRLAGTDIPLDEKLVAALPGKYPDILRQFRATARGDFVAEITQQHGINLSENEFRIDIRDGTMNYTQFPYPVEKVKGRIVVRTHSTNPKRPLRPNEPIRPLPERDEIVFDGLTGVHAGAAIWLNGAKKQKLGSRDRILTLHIGGTDCPIDADLRAALRQLKLDSVWTTFEPKGSITFAAEVEVQDRAAPPDAPGREPSFDPAADLKMAFTFAGPSVLPSFFPYEITELAGMLDYRNGQLKLDRFTGRHGETKLKLAAGEVRFYPDGAVWANLGGLELKPFTVDANLLAALPAKLRSGMEELKLKGNAELSVKHLVVLTPPDSPAANLPPPDPLPISPVAEPRAAVPAARSPAVAFARTARLGAPTNATPQAANRLIVRGQAPGPLPATPFPPTPTQPTPDPVVYWDAELKLAGASLDAGLPWEELVGSVACRGRYEGTHLGLVRGNVWLDRAVIARQPVSNLRGHVRAMPQLPDPTRPGEFLPIELGFTDLSGTLFHGILGGEARVVLAPQVRYELWLTATDVQLDEVARHYKLGSDADLKGLAQAQVHLYNRPDPRTGQLATEGAGKIDVPTGRMYNLPILLDLVKVFKWQLPDKTAFEEAHAVFRIQGDRVKVEQLDLIGNAVCVGGAGELDFEGDFVRFEFYVIWSKVLKQMINTPVGDLTAFLSKNLFKIRMERVNGELKYRAEPIPAVTEPMKTMTDRLKSRTGKLTPW